MKHRNVLIIEDNAAVVTTMKSLLELEGYKVYTANNGQEGIEILGIVPNMSVILLDMMMPVMNGWDFLEFQRAQSAYSKIPVVVVSAYGETAKTVKPDAIIHKPVKLDLLLSTVHKYCA
ncbi:MAG: response regulator [Bdellovibrionota bacterium]